MKYTSKSLFASAVLVGLLFSFITIDTAMAESGDIDTNNNPCVTLDNNMRYRMRDISVNNEVSDLQDYLIAEGYMSGSTSGFFGVATLKAVKSFQSANGLLSSGYVGPVTRAKIKALSCSEIVNQTGLPDIRPYPIKPPVMCTMEARLCPDGSTMYRDANCGWHAEMCKGESVYKRLPSITNVIISGNDTMIIYGNNLDLARNINLAGSANPNIDIRISFSGAIITSSYIKLENIRVKLEKYIVYTENGYNMTITINNDTQGTTSNTFQFYVPAMKNTLKAASAELYNITGFTNDNGKLIKYYAPGEKIMFSIRGYDSNGQIATPANGYNVQWHMYDYDAKGYRLNSTMVNGVYQSDNATFNYGTNLWDITATAPSANLPGGVTRQMEASLYCSSNASKSLGCSDSQIEKSFMFSINNNVQATSIKAYNVLGNEMTQGDIFLDQTTIGLSANDYMLGRFDIVKGNYKQINVDLICTSMMDRNSNIRISNFSVSGKLKFGGVATDVTNFSCPEDVYTISGNSNITRDWIMPSITKDNENITYEITGSGSWNGVGTPKNQPMGYLRFFGIKADGNADMLKVIPFLYAIKG